MRKSGFTLIEMIAVIVILAILAAALTAGLSTARNKAWRTQARETCRELCMAWNAYLLDVRKFPLKNASGLEANYENLKWIVSPEWMNAEDRKRHTGRIYLEISEQEKENGIKDHWGQTYRFSLDTDYDGEIDNPYPNAFEPSISKAKATVVAWSLGDPKRAKRDDNPIVIW